MPDARKDISLSARWNHKADLKLETIYFENLLHHEDATNDYKKISEHCKTKSGKALACLAAVGYIHPSCVSTWDAFMQAFTDLR